MKKILAMIIALAMVMSMAVVISADEVATGVVTISGKNYKEEVTYDTDYTAEVDAWGWNTPISYDTTPSIGDVVTALQGENAYIKIVASNTSSNVMIQSEKGTAGLNAPTFTITGDDNVTAYYLGTALIDAYLADTGAAIEDGFWNLVIQPSSSVVISDLEIVTLNEIVENEVKDAYKLVEKSVGTLAGVSGGDPQVMSITSVNIGDTVIVHIIGSSDGTFRTWLSKNTWSRASDITTVEAGEFDMIIEITALDADNKGITDAGEIQFKGPSGGSLDNLTVSYCGIFYGTMEEYEAAIEEALNASEEETTAEAGKYTGYIATGDDTHMIIINNAVITTAHEFDFNGDCEYCGYHTDDLDDDIIEIIDPTEPSTEEEEDETVDAEPEEDPEENPKTGLALALVPMMLAAAAVVITKK